MLNKGIAGWLQRLQVRHSQSARLLGGLQQDFLPAIHSLVGGGEQSLFAAGCGQGYDSPDAQFGGFFDGPFEGVEFDDGEQEGDVNRGIVRGDWFQEGEIDALSTYRLD